MDRREIIQKLGEVVFDNNFFNTLAGERFKEIYDVSSVQAAISFAGRSKKHESFAITAESDHELYYITHLYIDTSGHLMVQVCSEDDDDFAVLIHPSGYSIKEFETEVLKEWLNLLDI